MSVVTVLTAPSGPLVALSSLDEARAAAAMVAAAVGVGVGVGSDRPGPGLREPLGELDAIAGSGLLSLTVPRAFGGPDVERAVVVEVVRGLAAADPSIARRLVTHLVLQQALRDFGTPGTQELAFAAILRGEPLAGALATPGEARAAGARARPRQARPTIATAFDHVLHAAIDIGIARAALEGGIELVRGRASAEAEAEPAAEGSCALVRLGELTVRLEAAEALLERSAARIDAALAAPALDDQNTADASLAAAGARLFAAEAGREIAGGVWELAGAEVGGDRSGLGRHARGLRVHARHEPARWSHRHIGDHAVTGVAPPRHPLI